MWKGDSRKNLNEGVFFCEASFGKVEKAGSDNEGIGLLLVVPSPLAFGTFAGG